MECMELWRRETFEDYIMDCKTTGKPWWKPFGMWSLPLLAILAAGYEHYPTLQ
jgi:hypothetical protein